MDSGLKWLTGYVGSIETAHRLSQRMIDYMDRKASCMSVFIVVSSLWLILLLLALSPCLPRDLTVDRGRAKAVVLIDSVRHTFSSFSLSGP